MKKHKPILKLLSGVTALTTLTIMFSCCCPKPEPQNNTLTFEQYVEASKKYEQQKATETKETTFER